MTYKIRYKEIIMHDFYFDANSEEEAKHKFNDAVNNGHIDFSYGKVDYGEIISIKPESEEDL